MNKVTHIAFDANMFHNQELNENHIWFLSKLALYLGQYDSMIPRNATLQKWTGWGKNKVIKVCDELVEMGYLKVDQRFRKSGGCTSNSYQIVTKQIKITSEQTFEGENIEITDEDPKSATLEIPKQPTLDVVPSEQPETPNVLPIAVPKSNGAPSQNQTQLDSNNISFITPLENSKNLTFGEELQNTKSKIKNHKFYNNLISGLKQDLKIQTTEFDGQVLTEVATKIIVDEVDLAKISIKAHLRTGYRICLDNQITVARKENHERIQSQKKVNYQMPYWDIVTVENTQLRPGGKFETLEDIKNKQESKKTELTPEQIKIRQEFIRSNKKALIQAQNKQLEPTV